MYNKKERVKQKWGRGSLEKGFELHPAFLASLEPRKVKNQYARLAIQIPLSFTVRRELASFKSKDFAIPEL